MATQNNPFQYLQRFPQLGGDFKEPLDDALREQLDQRDRDLEDYLGKLGGGGRPHATRVVSHVDSQAIDKENADFIVTGVSDATSQINAALAAIQPLTTFVSPPAGDVRITDGYYPLNGSIKVPLYHMLEGAGRLSTILDQEVPVSGSNYMVEGYSTILLAEGNSQLHKLDIRSTGDGSGLDTTLAVVVLGNSASMVHCEVRSLSSVYALDCLASNAVSNVRLDGRLKVGEGCMISSILVFKGEVLVSGSDNAVSAMRVDGPTAGTGHVVIEESAFRNSLQFTCDGNVTVDGDDNIITAHISGNLTVGGDRNIVLGTVGGSVTDTGTGNLLTTT